MILFLGFIETILRQKQELLIPNWGYLIPLRHCNSKTFLTSGCLSTNQAREEGFIRGTLPAQNLLRSAVAHTDDVQPALQVVESASVSRVNRLDACIPIEGSGGNSRASFLREISCIGIRHGSIYPSIVGHSSLEICTIMEHFPRV